MDTTKAPPADVIKAFEEQRAKELIRIRQQGRGRPMISMEWHGLRIVAVGNTLYWSKNWKTFPDFLGHYIKKVLGSSWGNAELAKPLEQRHPVLQWYDEVCRLQKASIASPGVVATANMTGAASAYFRLAYNLYLLAHNTKNDTFDEQVQHELIRRLQRCESFPGAYYEADVFGSLIKAGFEIEFEDQSGKQGRRCEAVIRYKETGSKFSVEAKAIHRKGALGAEFNAADPGQPLVRSIRNQLYNALGKIAPHPRIVFIDLNVQDDGIQGSPRWLDEGIAAVANAENLTIHGAPTDSAYVILTNRSDHYNSQSTAFTFAAAAVGYKIDDFGDGKVFDGLVAQYRAKQKHIAVHQILASLRGHHEVPATFDGELPSVAFGNAQPPVRIGERYIFENVGGEDIEATVTCATVDETKMLALVGTDTGQILQHPITQEQLEDYRRYGDAFFGLAKEGKREMQHPFELFEWILDSYSETPKERLLELLGGDKVSGSLSALSRDELALLVAERSVCSVLAMQKKSAAD